MLTALTWSDKLFPIYLKVSALIWYQDVNIWSFNCRKLYAENSVLWSFFIFLKSFPYNSFSVAVDVVVKILLSFLETVVMKGIPRLSNVEVDSTYQSHWPIDNFSISEYCQLVLTMTECEHFIIPATLKCSIGHNNFTFIKVNQIFLLAYNCRIHHIKMNLLRLTYVWR